jgi:hypothetical protein
LLALCFLAYCSGLCSLLFVNSTKQH